MTSMLEGVTLSLANYDALLTALEAGSPPSDVPFDVGSSQYSAGAPAEARARLVSDYGCTITDGGEL